MKRSEFNAGRMRQMLGAGALAGVLLLVGLSAYPDDGAGGEGRRTAEQLVPSTVVATLRSAGALPEEIRSAMAAYRARPAVPQTALAAAQALIGEARRSGDARLSGAALAVLQTLVLQGDPTGIHLAAVARQQQHDFSGALVLLDRLLTDRPDHLDARLLRATLHLVQGDIPSAREDCGALIPLAPAPGFLCLVSTYTLSPEAPDIARELDRLLQAGGGVEGTTRAWALSLAGEIAWMQGDLRGAETALRAALALDPAGQREAVMLADVLLEGGRAAEVQKLLAGFPATDAVSLRLLRAAGDGAGVGRALVRDARRALAARVAESQALGLSAHAREEGQFLLWIEGDAATALERAEANWRNQKEYDDAVLLVQAAIAAGQPERARPVIDWIAVTGTSAPALMRHLPAPPSPPNQGDQP